MRPKSYFSPHERVIVPLIDNCLYFNQNLATGKLEIKKDNDD